MSGTWRGRPAPIRTRHPDEVESDALVLFTMRGQVAALDREGEPDGVTHLTLWECAACPGWVIWGDRLTEHRAWHGDRS